MLDNLTNKDKRAAIDKLISGSTPSKDFFMMIVFSVLTATFGLLTKNIPVVIGSMLIAPMLYPILSLALAITINDTDLIARSLKTVIKSVAVGVSAAAFASLLFSTQHSLTPEDLYSTNEASIISAAIAIIAGLAASFALVKPKLSETLPGVAISVTLIPPISSIGIGVAMLNMAVITSSLLLFLINVFGIIFAGAITFSLMGFYAVREEADKTIEKEDKEL